jgi:hypothetical protein
MMCLLVIAAAEQHLIVRNTAALDLASVAVAPEIGDPVVAAGIGAAPLT